MLDTIQMIIANDGQALQLVVVVFLKKEHSVEGIFKWLFEKDVVFAKEEDIELLIAGKNIVTAVRFDGYVAVCVAIAGAKTIH